MKRSLYLRLFIFVMVASASLLLLSYVHARTTHTDDQNCESGKCPSNHDPSGRARTEYILWESLTHNLLTSNR